MGGRKDHTHRANKQHGNHKKIISFHTVSMDKIASRYAGEEQRNKETALLGKAKEVNYEKHYSDGGSSFGEIAYRALRRVVKTSCRIAKQR